MKYLFLSVILFSVGFFVGAYAELNCPAVQRCSVFSCCNNHAKTSMNNVCSCPNCHCREGQPCSCKNKCDCNGGVSCPGKHSKDCKNCVVK